MAKLLVKDLKKKKQRAVCNQVCQFSVEWLRYRNVSSMWSDFIGITSGDVSLAIPLFCIIMLFWFLSIGVTDILVSLTTFTILLNVHKFYERLILKHTLHKCRLNANWINREIHMWVEITLEAFWDLVEERLGQKGLF